MMKMTKNCRRSDRLQYCWVCAVILFSAVLGACANQTAEGIDVVAADGSVKQLLQQSPLYQQLAEPQLLS